MSLECEPSSFRDPGGFIFRREGALYRQVQPAGADDYTLLMKSGLYDDLTSDGLLIPHTECEQALGFSDEAFRVLKPEPIPFISYPYEWSFSQLKLSRLSPTQQACRGWPIASSANIFWRHWR